MTNFATTTPAAHVREAATAAAKRYRPAPGISRQALAGVRQTLKHSARFLLKDLPLVSYVSK